MAANPFENLRYEDFKRLASDTNLSKYERIGFPDSYRAGVEDRIFADICSKLTNIDGRNKKILDIGPGCSDLPIMLLDKCARQGHSVDLIDSAEMLGRLPDAPHVKKLAAHFPNCPEFIETHAGTFDAILCYSVLHYILLDVAFFRFLDISLSLLAPQGQFLIGDIPNISKRKRFFASETGQKFHKNFMKTTENPVVVFNAIEHDQIDDAIVAAIVARARSQGFDAYAVPQDPQLPMANRREDILIIRP